MGVKLSWGSLPQVSVLTDCGLLLNLEGQHHFDDTNPTGGTSRSDVSALAVSSKPPKEIIFSIIYYIDPYDGNLNKIT